MKNIKDIKILKKNLDLYSVNRNPQNRKQASPDTGEGKSRKELDQGLNLHMSALLLSVVSSSRLLKKKSEWRRRVAVMSTEPPRVMQRTYIEKKSCFGGMWYLEESKMLQLSAFVWESFYFLFYFFKKGGSQVRLLLCLMYWVLAFRIPQDTSSAEISTVVCRGGLPGARTLTWCRACFLVIDVYGSRYQILKSHLTKRQEKKKIMVRNLLWILSKFITVRWL